MNIQLIKNKFDNIMVEHDISIRKYIENPITVATKAETPLWQFYSVKASTRSHDNIDQVFALTLDYDKGIVTIDKFIEAFKDFAYVLYTTYSHTNTHHKFRVVIPLAKPIKFSLLKDSKYGIVKILTEYFQHNFGENTLDRTSFTNFQAIPSYGNDKSQYRYHINSSNNKFSLKQFEPSIIENKRIFDLNAIIEMQPNSEDKVSRYIWRENDTIEHSDFTRAYINKHVIPFMESIRWDIDGQYERNNSLVEKCGMWKKYATSNQLDISLIRNTVLGYLRDRNYRKMVNKYVR